MSKSYICVFDCETVPDTALLRRVYGYRGSDLDVCKAAFWDQKEASGSEFLPVMFHKVVAISAVMADEFGRFLRVSTMKGENEQEILAKFINFINEYNPRLISFNGRGFDLPMIMVRSMRYNLSCPAYFESDNKELNKNKWENYRSRYDGRFHLDLLDHISDFRAVSGLKLDTLCASLNLPGKYDIHGDQVMQLFFAGEIAKINEYCESDTLNTYWLFLKYELLRGNLTKDDYASFLADMSEFLIQKCSQMGYTPVFCEAIEMELARLKGELDYEIVARDFDESEDDEPFVSERIDINDLEDHLVKSGLGGMVKKANEINLKAKSQTKFEERLPEINLDDE